MFIDREDLTWLHSFRSAMSVNDDSKKRNQTCLKIGSSDIALLKECIAFRARDL